MIIDCVSDLHGSYPKDLEGGDILIVAGDWTARDEHEEYFEFLHWLKSQSYNDYVIIGGNHDMLLQKEPCINKMVTNIYHIHYLENSGVKIGDFKIWGSPHTKYFYGVNPDCTAFMLHTDSQMAETWDKIPLDTDILITHGPSMGILDHTRNKMRVGCSELAKYINRLKPDLHICGHIHEGYGIYQSKDTRYINCAHMNVDYKPINKPIRICYDSSGNLL